MNLLVVGPSIPEILHQGLSTDSNRTVQSRFIHPDGRTILHHPLIALRPIEVPFQTLLHLSRAERLIITSKHSAFFLNQALKKLGLTSKFNYIYCVGKASARAAHAQFPEATIAIATEERQEGILDMVTQAHCIPFSFGTSIAWPRSKMARPLLSQILTQKGIEILDVPLYEPYETKNIPSLENIDEIFFSCPSSVRAFFALFAVEEVSHLAFSAIGPITKKQLEQKGISHVRVYPTSSSI